MDAELFGKRLDPSARSVYRLNTAPGQSDEGICAYANRYAEHANEVRDQRDYTGTVLACVHQVRLCAVSCRGKNRRASADGVQVNDATTWQIDPAHTTIEFAVKHS